MTSDKPFHQKQLKAFNSLALLWTIVILVAFGALIACIISYKQDNMDTFVITTFTSFSVIICLPLLYITFLFYRSSSEEEKKIQKEQIVTELLSEMKR